MNIRYSRQNRGMKGTSETSRAETAAGGGYLAALAITFAGRFEKTTH